MEGNSTTTTGRSAQQRTCAATETQRDDILGMVRGIVEVCSVPAAERPLDEWMAVVREATQAMSIAAAARDAAITRLAAIDEVVSEHGVVVEQVNGLGSVALDAGAMVATATGTTTRFAEQLVEQAVDRVVRLPDLHQAMLDGLLDDYKARCVASEIADVPLDLARAVLDDVRPVMGTTSGPALRHRVRDALFRLAPELLDERIRKARAKVGVRRWTGEPGTDNWSAVLPAERSATTWAAIDALAREYLQGERYPTLEQCRAYALLDLVDGQATVETVVHFTVPAEAMAEASVGTADDDGDGATPRAAADGPAAAGPSSDESTPCEPTPCDPAPFEPMSGGQMDGPASGDSDAETASSLPTSAASAARTAFVGVRSARGVETQWFPAAVIATARAHQGNRSEGASLGAGMSTLPGFSAVPCHPVNGAMLDVGDRLATDAYRPGRRLRRLVRQRDGRCRFPGCVVSARQCDIDHVAPWPGGRTSATNLMCLCRRHHRIKQRYRWSVRLDSAAVAHWSDPSGHVLTTEPVDHLRSARVRVARVRSATPDELADMALEERELDFHLAALEERRREQRAEAEAEAEAPAAAAAAARATQSEDLVHRLGPWLFPVLSVSRDRQLARLEARMSCPGGPSGVLGSCRFPGLGYPRDATGSGFPGAGRAPWPPLGAASRMPRTPFPYGVAERAVTTRWIQQLRSESRPLASRLGPSRGLRRYRSRLEQIAAPVPPEVLKRRRRGIMTTAEMDELAAAGIDVRAFGSVPEAFEARDRVLAAAAWKDAVADWEAEVEAVPRMGLKIRFDSRFDPTSALRMSRISYRPKRRYRNRIRRPIPDGDLPY